MADLFQHPTIVGHTELILQSLGNTQNIDENTWFPLHLIQGKKQFAAIAINHHLSFRCS